MKKIFLLLLVCFMQNIRADELSDAIRASDVEKVKLLLQNKPVNKSFTKYLDTAEQVIRSRRDAVIADKLDHRIYFDTSDSEFKRRIHWMELSGLSFISSLYASSRIDDLTTHAKFKGIKNYLSAHGFDSYRTMERIVNTSSAISFIGILKYCKSILDLGQEHTIKFHKDLIKVHDNSVTIKEMLYDHLNAVETL